MPDEESKQTTAAAEEPAAPDGMSEEQLESTLRAAIEGGESPEEKPVDLKISLDEKGDISEPPTDEKEPGVEEPEKSETKVEETDKKPSDADMLKALKHLKNFNSLEDADKAYGDLNNKYRDELQPLLWAQKHAPHLLGDFYTKLGRAIVGDKDLPKVEHPLKGRTNPNTGEAYTDEELKASDAWFETMASRLGFVKSDQLEEREKKSRYDNDLKEAALNVKRLEEQWKPKLEKIGLNWEKNVAVEVSNFLTGMGITADNPHLITPENLAHALNAVLMRDPNTISMIAANAKAEGARDEQENRGRAATLPTTAAKVQAEPGDFLERFSKLTPEQQGKAIIEMIKNKPGGMKVPLLG